MKEEEMIKILHDFADFINKKENKEEKEKLCKYYKGYFEALKGYCLSEARYKYHFGKN